MRFVVKKEIFEELPSACFGIVMAKGIDNNNAYPVIEQFLDESIQAAMQRFEGRKVKEDPDITISRSIPSLEYPIQYRTE